MAGRQKAQKINLAQSSAFANNWSAWRASPYAKNAPRYQTYTKNVPRTGQNPSRRTYRRPGRRKNKFEVLLLFKLLLPFPRFPSDALTWVLNAGFRANCTRDFAKLRGTLRNRTTLSVVVVRSGLFCEPRRGNFKDHSTSKCEHSHRLPRFP